jgi:photosystem II stability/assembly factor-like uncharacterized protein
MKLAVAYYGGPIFTSTDGGVNWVPRMTDLGRPWLWISSSPDGMKLAAVANGGQVYTSADGGANWVPRESVRNWRAASMSSDGVRLAAVASDSRIYTAQDGSVTGEQYSACELVYSGGGQWLLVSQQGSLNRP